MSDTKGQKKRVVTVGGGTGTHTVLKGLKRYADKLDITAIVTMADSGGSTGRLRDEFGHLPVGDARMALAALSADVDAHDELLRELFLYRFAKGDGLCGHNFGNLLLTALTDLLGSEVEAIETASRILRVRGRVVPVTTDDVHLKAEYDDGVVIIGEHDIDEPLKERNGSRIRRLSVTPAATINPQAADALRTADLIVLGPGDLYTSILANVVVDGFSAAVAQSSARLVYVSNLMSKVGQTKGMHAQEHIDELARYVGRTPEYVLLNTEPIDPELIERYHEEENDHPIENNCVEGVCTIHATDLLAKEAFTTPQGDVLKRSLVRHDSDKLASAILSLL